MTLNQTKLLRLRKERTAALAFRRAGVPRHTIVDGPAAGAHGAKAGDSVAGVCMPAPGAQA